MAFMDCDQDSLSVLLSAMAPARAMASRIRLIV